MSIYGVNGVPQLTRIVTPGDPASAQAVVAELAAVSGQDPTVLGRALVELALNVEGVLREMDARHQGTDAASLPGSTVLFEELTPRPAPVDGAALLTALAETFSRYVVLPAGGADLLALWVVHSYALDAAQVTPILALVSPQKRCGKTRCLSVLQALVHRPLPGSNLTPAVVFRAIEALHPTLLVDEADTFMRNNEELRGVLNSGHTRSMAYVLRMVPVDDGFEPRQFSTWCAKAIAGIGALPDTLHDRAIALTLQRKTKDERVSRWRAAHTRHLLPLRQQCLAWVTQHLDTLRQATPELLDALHDRAADNWEPLLAIAETAGGPWLDDARKAIAKLEGLRPEDDSAAVLLLKDMHALFTERKTDRLLSSELVEGLKAMEARPWPAWGKGKPITPRQVAKLLAPFGVRPKTVREGQERGKGYVLQDCTETFSRYLEFPSVTPCQGSNDADLCENRSVTQAGRVTDEKSHNPVSDNSCHSVTDRQGGAQELWQKSGDTYGWRQEL